jgi:hypothetical protein
VFSKKGVNTLVDYSPYNYIINLIEGKELLYGLLYNISETELAVL